MVPFDVPPLGAGVVEAPARTTRAGARLACLALLAWASTRSVPASAHQQSATFGEVSQDGAAGREIVWRLRVRSADLQVALPLPASAAARSPGATNYLRAGLQVAADGRPCAPSGSTLAPESNDAEMLVFVQRFDCRPGAEAFRLRYDLFFETDRYHQSFTRLLLAQATHPLSGGEALSATVIFREGLREIAVGTEEPTVWQSARLYLRLGIFHILTGYDHLSFLMALLLGAALRQRTTGDQTAAAASVRGALSGTFAIVSAFTVAHSLTLAIQVLRPGWISTRWVEPAIALSVAYVGFENLLPRLPRRRWLLVFGFGLVHGLGFASVLREIGLPRRGLVLSLLAFNLGVEIGQLLVLSLVFPVIVLAARRSPRRFERWGLQAGSAIIGVFGTVWLVVRLVAILRG
jgi:hydrogenase/urease accessory protein HupE